MYVCSFLFFLILINGKFNKTDAINARLLEGKTIKKESEYEISFDIGKKFKSNHYKLSGAENCDGTNNLMSAHLENYVMKYINNFLFLLNLQDKETSLKDNEVTKINLEFVINGKDLKFIKHMSENFKSGKALDKLYKLDAILSGGLKKSLLNEDRSFASITAYYKDIILNSLMSKDFQFGVFLCSTVILLIFRSYRYFSFWNYFFILLNFLIISEGYEQYLNKIKDAEDEDFITYLDNYNNENACNPKEVSGWWWSNYFGGNKCINHIKRNKRTANTIFPLASILNVYMYYVLQIPSEAIGICLKSFSEKLNDDLWPFFKQFGMRATYLLVFLFFIIFYILWMKPRLSLSFFGINFRFSLSGETDRIANNSQRLLADEESFGPNRIENLVESHSKENGKEKKKIAPADWNKVSITDQVDQSTEKEMIKETETGEEIKST